VFRCNIFDGLYPFASTGSFTARTTVSGNSYTIVGDGVHVANSSGTYSYTLANRTTGKATFVDTVGGTSTFYLGVGDQSEGAFTITQPSCGFQNRHIHDYRYHCTNGCQSRLLSQCETDNATTSIVRGTASDNIQVSSVMFRLNGGDWTQASGTTSWEATATLTPGTNAFQVFSVDSTGNQSTIISQKPHFCDLCANHCANNGIGDSRSQLQRTIIGSRKRLYHDSHRWGWLCLRKLERECFDKWINRKIRDGFRLLF